MEFRAFSVITSNGKWTVYPEKCEYWHPVHLWTVIGQINNSTVAESTHIKTFPIVLYTDCKTSVQTWYKQWNLKQTLIDNSLLKAVRWEWEG